MATMIPEQVCAFETEGERRFYNFLEVAAKPDSHFIAWYLPEINEREPDFLLFSESLGLIIFGVKDWAIDQILEANATHFALNKGGRTEYLKNPFRQARNYYGAVADKIREDGCLISRERHAYGNPKIPICYGVVFPNIQRLDYLRRDYDKVISADKIFFLDDLRPDSDLCADKSGKQFLETIKRMFVPQFAFKISGKELNHLRQLLFPMVKVDLPIRERHACYEENIRRLKVLDQNQERIARKCESGHRIVIGPSGTGKTLVLVHKAAFLLQYNPAIRKILFVCYNITLVNYIKRLLANKRVPLGESGVEVFHFYELCSRILGQSVAYEKEDEDYYKLITEEALSKTSACNLKYDAILIDEGQDFSDDMYKVVMKLLNPQTDNLTIALDDNQNLYRRKQAWKEVGVNAQGRVQKLSFIYRNTHEIASCAAKILDNPSVSSADQRDTAQTNLFDDKYDFHGPKPEVKAVGTFHELLTYVTDKITDLIDKEAYPLSEIAILYTRRYTPGKRDIDLPLFFIDSLKSKGLVYQWASEDYQSKIHYDITTDCITLSTVHSVKGLDYACVFIVGLDLLAHDKIPPEDMRNLVYVAMTRARERLYIPYVTKTPMMAELISCV